LLAPISIKGHCPFKGHISIKGHSHSLNVPQSDDVKLWMSLLVCICFECILTAVQSDMNDNWHPRVWHGLYSGDHNCTFW